MKLNVILLLLAITILSSCGKKTQVKGIVYSKHNIPVPKASIYLETYKYSDYPTSTKPGVATTDNNGSYQFSFTGTKRNYYHVKCISDSGIKGEYINLGSVNNIDLHLE